MLKWLVSVIEQDGMDPASPVVVKVVLAVTVKLEVGATFVMVKFDPETGE